MFMVPSFTICLRLNLITSHIPSFLSMEIDLPLHNVSRPESRSSPPQMSRAPAVHRSILRNHIFQLASIVLYYSPFDGPEIKYALPLRDVHHLQWIFVCRRNSSIVAQSLFVPEKLKETPEVLYMLYFSVLYENHDLTTKM